MAASGQKRTFSKDNAALRLRFSHSGNLGDYLKAAGLLNPVPMSTNGWVGGSPPTPARPGILVTYHYNEAFRYGRPRWLRILEPLTVRAQLKLVQLTIAQRGEEVVM